MSLLTVKIRDKSYQKVLSKIFHFNNFFKKATSRTYKTYLKRLSSDSHLIESSIYLPSHADENVKFF